MKKMASRNVLWILMSIFLLQHSIYGASIGLSNKNGILLEKKEVQRNVENFPPQELTYKGSFSPEEKYEKSLNQKPASSVIRKSHTNKWDFRQLQSQYEMKPYHSYRPIKGDTNTFDLRMNVDGFQVNVISSPKAKELSSNQDEKGVKTGHVIEIIPNKITADESVIEEESNCEDEDVREDKIGNDDLSLGNVQTQWTESSSERNLKGEVLKTETFSEIDTSAETFNSDHSLSETIIGLNEPDEGSGRFLHINGDNSDEDSNISDSETEDNELRKSSRIVDIFFRSNNSPTACKTPTGEAGHCKRITECLLSDALNNFSLFLQYLCLMSGPFVGICCPDNPVIETKDGDANTTVQEFKLPEEGCGKNSNLRIVGGTLSLPHQWTWMVALLRRSRFFCGGVIINDWYILTAAHCVMGLKIKDLKVRLGEYNFSEKNEHQQDIPIAEIKQHAQFVSLTFQHDIALLKLKSKVEYSKFIGSICLPESRDYTQVNATVVGWGTLSFGGAASSILRQVTIPVWSNEECDKIYVFESITNSFMCAGSPETGEDACQGDSGGPLMALNKEGRWEVIGIVSWGRRCGDPVYPGVYTRVSTYLNWIQENMN